MLNYISVFEAVPRGQNEAARATGMTALHTMWHVVLPQAVKLMIPPMWWYLRHDYKRNFYYLGHRYCRACPCRRTCHSTTPKGADINLRMTAILYFAYCYPVLRLAHWAELITVVFAYHRRYTCITLQQDRLMNENCYLQYPVWTG